MTSNENKSIHLVENEPELAALYSIILARAGYKFEIAHSVREAFDLATEQPPDLILLHLRTPVIDSVESLKRYTENHPDVSLIIVSSRDVHDEIDSAIDLGPHQYVVKSSVSSTEFREIVEHSYSLARGSIVRVVDGALGT